MKVVLQDGIKDCGVCCLLSVVRYYGGEISKEYLREITQTNKGGVSAYFCNRCCGRLEKNRK